MPQAIGRALWTGALAGLAAGVVDTLSSWGRIDQFLPGAGGKLVAALHAGGLYAFILSLAAVAVAAVALVLTRHTALGPLLARLRDPDRAFTATALAIAAIPCLVGALVIAYQIGYLTILRRNHKGLVIVVTVAATFALLVGAVLATFAVGRLLELALRRLPRRPLSRPLSPVVAASGLLALTAVVGAALSWKLLVQLPLRPYLAGIGWALLCIPAAPVATRLLAGAGRLRAFAHPALVVGALLVALVTGASDAVRKATAAHTGLTVPATKLVQRLFDLDRDGYSSVLGGGDCDDLDGDVHPGALDIPGDGVDQNCLGGDVRPAEAVDSKFVAVPEAVPRDANVLLVTIDTLRADHVGAYGYRRPTTPALDALAARGSLFQNAWAHAPSTRYSMPAILTGRHPSKVAWNMDIWWPGVLPENLTLAEVLKERGFQTGAIFNYHYFDPVRGFNQGFDHYDNSNARLHTGRDPASTRGSSSREQADAAIRFIETHAGRRFFLWVHFYDPHYEFEPHPGSPSFGTDPIALYDGEIRFTDDHIARVLARLGELGLTDKTIVVVTGDHGEGFGEHGVMFHGYDLYAAQTKVPLIIVVPGLAPRRVETPVGHVDLLPTLANLVGSKPDPAGSGRSLLGLMLGEEDPTRAIFQEVSSERGEKRALATRDRHLLYNMIPWGTFELYDLAADPEETRDIWGQSSDGAELAERLAVYIDAQAHGLASALLSSPPRPRVPVRGDFGGAVRFLGADLPEGGGRAGEEVEITWYWESRKRLPAGYKPFVHFEGPRFINADHEPAGGVWPMARWKPGQLIADRQKLRLPRGEYTIYVGVFRGNERLPLTGAGAAAAGQDRLKVGALTVR